MRMRSVLGIAKLAPIISGGACAILAAAPALAEIKVSGARITEGQLWVLGQADEPNAPVTLDGAFEQTTDGRGRFEFRVVYHPATCIVSVKTAAQVKQAVVAGCGQAGPKGDPGPEGRPGPPGPAGLPGVSELRGTMTGEATEPREAGPAPAQTAPRPPVSTPRSASPQASPAPPEPTHPPAQSEPARPKVERAAPAAPASPVLGEWLVEDGTARIAVQPCGGAVCGAVSWSKDGGGLGTQILRSMKPAGPNRFEGTIYDPQSGRTYQSTISLQNPSALRVEGCVLGFLCGGQTWTRAK
jgi:hypothetical protein